MKINWGTGTDMTRYACGTAMVLLFISLVPQAWGQQYFLYSPKPVTSEESKQTGDSVLVREVAVQSGDTLYRISRRFSGHGMYYPQILLFNDIKNPNLIHTGDTLKVPVTKERSEHEGDGVVPAQRKKSAGRKHKAARKQQPVSAVPAQSQPAETRSATGQLSELPLSELKPAGKAKKKRALSDVRKLSKREQRREALSARKPVAADGSKPAATPRPATADSSAGQQLFEQAIKAYRQDDCRTALDLFDRFLAKYPTLPQAADASLYKAECYMKLSR